MVLASLQNVTTHYDTQTVLRNVPLRVSSVGTLTRMHSR